MHRGDRYRRVYIKGRYMLSWHPFEWIFAVFPNDEYQVAVVFCGPISIWRV